jgi:hypothetical protein
MQTNEMATVSTSNSNNHLELDLQYKEHRRKRVKRYNVGDSKFDVYIANSNLMHDVKDPSAWWKANETHFLNLSRMAKDYLAVPLLGCTVKKMFSVSKRIAIWQRNHLSTEHISETMIYNSQLKRDGLWQKVHDDAWIDVDASDDGD